MLSNTENITVYTRFCYIDSYKICIIYKKKNYQDFQKIKNYEIFEKKTIKNINPILPK